MSRRPYRAATVLLIASLGVSGLNLLAQIPPQGIPRDTPAQQRESPPSGSGRIAGRILSADGGRPLSRALVRITPQGIPGGRAALTDNAGAFEFTELPAGRYALMASKTGYVGLSYGQRRPLQAGTPLQLSEGQELKGIELRLPRGSAIGGRVYEEGGDPLPGATVRVMRYQYVQGTRQLVPAGSAQTDDRGEYRVWGINPGDYYVSAIARNVALNPGGRGIAFQGGPAGRGGPAVARGALAAAFAGQDDPEQEGYAPTYYPGVPSVHEARAVTVGLAAEALGIDFGVLLVRTSRVAGRVTSADGSPATSGNVTLISDGFGGRGGLPGSVYNSRIQDDGAFSIVNVPPGRYLLRARSEGPRNRDYVPPQFALLPLTVDGNISDLSVPLVPGATISGTVTFQATQSTDPPQTNQFRILASLIDPSDMGPPSTARIEPDGTFLLVGVPAGTLWIRAQAPAGWALTSAVLDGRDSIDTPFEVRGGEKITGMHLLFKDKQSEITGTLTDEQGAPITEYTVLAFPTDSTLWRPQARQIRTVRPDQVGRFQLRGLPPGDYYVATIDPVEPGEWFEPAFLEEHRTGAARLTLREGDVKTQDFKISTR